jgi:lon-related putative ATP-dependent protease
MDDIKYNNTTEVNIPAKLIDQVIGQDKAVDVIRNAAERRRHVMLIGDPGTGKSLLARAMSDILPTNEMYDILVHKNPKDENQPIIEVVRAGMGSAYSVVKATSGGLSEIVLSSILMASMFYGALFFIPIFLISVIFLMLGLFSLVGSFGAIRKPKILIHHDNPTKAPFVDATGAHAGALLGDIRHDPLQCIPGGELIVLPNGNICKIEDLVDRHMVVDGEIDVSDLDICVLGGDDERFGLCSTKITKMFRRRYNDDVLKITTRSGDVIRCTPNHPMAYLNRESCIDYIESERVGIGLNPIVPFRTEFSSNEDLTKDMAADKFVKRLKSLSHGSYAFDNIVSIDREHYDGYVYNLTTTTGNYFVNFMLTHNSGGLGTPAHERVEAGDIHRANGGVLYVDEINSMDLSTQQSLLTALQEGQYPITAHHPQSSGALTKTQPVPCKFVMVVAGNMDAIQKMHPALRSRIRGNGYEVLMETSMPNTPENREKVIQFIAQEVRKDHIPHFDRGGIAAMINEARVRADKSDHLTLHLRDLGGIIRAAGDVAIRSNAQFVTAEHVEIAKGSALTIEDQAVNQYTKNLFAYHLSETEGIKVGRVNGLALFGGTAGGMVLPIISAVAPGTGVVTATGMLKEIAQESVMNVSAVVKNITGKDMKNLDIFVQFVGTYQGVEGDSASISVATSIISAIENIPVKQDIAMTGSITVRGTVLPIGGVSHKIEGALKAGIKKIIIPKSNVKDVSLNEDTLAKVEIIPVETIYDVMLHSLDCTGREDLLEKAKAMV